MSDPLTRLVINRIQEQQTFAAHYELWFSRGGTVQRSLSGPPALDTGEYSPSRPAALPLGKRIGYEAGQLTEPHCTLRITDNPVRDIRSSRWHSSELCR
jgi:hypothetical protein